MNLGDRLLSRKWWLAVAACCFFASQGPVAFDNIAQIVIAYLAVNAATEAFGTYTASRTTEPEPTPVSPASDGDDEEVSGWTGSVT